MHPPVADLDRYHSGLASPEESARVRTHVELCESCSVYLRETDMILDELRRFSFTLAVEDESSRQTETSDFDFASF